MNLHSLLNDHLNDRRGARLAETIVQLETAIANGMVPNTLFTDAKFTINNGVERAAEAFLQTGPRRADGHDRSAWWHGAYEANAFVHGAHGVPAALKRAEKAGLTDYAAFLTAELLPLHTLLQSAKPLIRKRGDMPKVKTTKQLADEADQMTCQCCGRAIFAATGTIAHHGYQRPGDGWQTASCFGAKRLPWEVSRGALGELIAHLKVTRTDAIETRRAVVAETAEVTHRYTVYNRATGQHDRKTLFFTRATLDAVKAENKGYISLTFDDYKAIDLKERAQRIKSLGDDIEAMQTRYDGWKQTHRRADAQEVLPVGSSSWVAL